MSEASKRAWALLAFHAARVAFVDCSWCGKRARVMDDDLTEAHGLLATFAGEVERLEAEIARLRAVLEAAERDDDEEGP